MSSDMEQMQSSESRFTRGYEPDTLLQENGRAFRIAIYKGNEFIQYKDSKLWIDEDEALMQIQKIKKELKHKNFNFRLVVFKFIKMSERTSLSQMSKG